MSSYFGQSSYYDHRVKHAIALTGDINLFPELNIPSSTARVWIKKGKPQIIDIETFDLINKAQLKRKVQEQKREIVKLKYLLEISKQVSRKLNLTLKNKRIKDINTRKEIVALIDKNKNIITYKTTLSYLDISESRYKRWKKEIITEKTNSPQSNEYTQRYSGSLTKQEFEKLKELYTDPQFAHFPIKSLHYYAKREGLLHCCLSTWYKYAKEFEFKRTFINNSKKDFKEGIRALAPNHIWHIDTL